MLRLAGLEKHQTHIAPGLSYNDIYSGLPQRREGGSTRLLWSFLFYKLSPSTKYISISRSWRAKKLPRGVQRKACCTKA